MSARPSSLLPAILLAGVSVGVASAAPTASKPTQKSRVKPGVGGICTKPTKAQCLSAKYRATKCGKASMSTCRPILLEELEADYESRPGPMVKMLRPNRNEMPDDVRQGKVDPYGGPDAAKELAGGFPKIRTASGVSNPGAPTVTRAPASARSVPRNDDRLANLGSTRPSYKLGKTSNKHGLDRLTSDNIVSRTGLTRPPHTGLGIDVPYNAHRNPAWESNGNKVASCEEFAYEMVYDWTRYTDAVAACSGDIHCELDVAFLPSTPGIADRVLRAKDGRPLTTQLTAKKTLRTAKNDLFAMGDKFVYAGGPGGIAKSAKLDQMAADLKKGKVYYVTTGCKSGCKGNEFKDQWDYHRKMHGRNRTVSEAEFAEYERRKAKFRELVWLWGQAVKREKDKITSGDARVVAEWVNPLDMVTADPFERVALMDEIQKTARTTGRALLRKNKALLQGLPGAGLTNKPVALGATHQESTSAPAPTPSTQGKTRTRGKVRRGKARGRGFRGRANKRRSGAVPAAGMLGYVPGKPKPSTQTGNPSTTGPSVTKPGSTQVGVVNCHPSAFGAKKSETLGIGPISCQIGQFLREEYDRKLHGKKSCLDLGNDDCDWSPSMFEAAFTEGVPYLAEQNAYEVECVGYTGDVFDKPKKSLAATEQYIEAMKVLTTEAEKTLMPYNQGTVKHGRHFGKGWADADHFGDKGWLAAGYDYDLGWGVHPVASKNKDVCELGGQARGGFGVDGWFMGGKFPIVDGLATAEYNQGGSKQTKVHAHLEVFKKNVFDPVDETFTGAWGEPLVQDGVDIPSGYKPSFTVWAGPIPITGAVWGEFFYGARFDIALLAQTNPNCDMQAVKLGATAIFTPQLGLNAKAQVGIGISGLLSAGIRGLVNLVTVGVPVTVTLSTTIKNISESAQLMLGFDLDVGLSLSTLSGWLAVYVEFLMFEEEFIFFEWNGVGPTTISLLGKPLEVDLPIFRMKK